MAGPASSDEISALESFAGHKLPSDYVQFMKLFGSAIVGSFHVFGVGVAEAMGSGTAVEETRKYRADGWPDLGNDLVVSADQAGNPVTLTENGRLILLDHDAGDVVEIAKTFEDFIENWCLRLNR